MAESLCWELELSSGGRVFLGWSFAAGSSFDKQQVLSIMVSSYFDAITRVSGCGIFIIHI